MILSWLLAFFIIMPIAEVAVLIKVNHLVGLGNTIAIVVLTGFGGALLARWQGLMVVMDIQRDLAEGRMPAPRLIDGVMILMAGLLLITPGLITDTVGFLLLVPVVRKEIRVWLRRKLEAKFGGGPDVTVWRW